MEMEDEAVAAVVVVVERWRRWERKRGRLEYSGQWSSEKGEEKLRQQSSGPQLFPGLIAIFVNC
ncbi:hypothetical protein QQP08_001508 [Theobroma cacao]|nr:hypothetical protein QQP08_001508 [Theobroma cacao]